MRPDTEAWYEPIKPSLWLCFQDIHDKIKHIKIWAKSVKSSRFQGECQDQGLKKTVTELEM